MRPVYGIVEPLDTYNPLKATFHEWASMAGDFASVRGWRNKLRALFAPPAWAADYHARRVRFSGSTPCTDRDNRAKQAYGRVSNDTQTVEDSVSCRHAADAVGAACITWHKGHIYEEM